MRGLRARRDWARRRSGILGSNRLTLIVSEGPAGGISNLLDWQLAAAVHRARELSHAAPDSLQP